MSSGNSESGILEYVLSYHGRGLCIIPVKAGLKRAACRWKSYQANRPAESTLRRWFSNGHHFPAVVLGGVSGGLVCRDFDKAEAYLAWKSQHPDLAATLPTVQTGRGYHVYFDSPWNGFQEFDDGELRGDSLHYCVLPPAPHPSGKNYTWLVPLPDGPLPQLDPFANGLAGSLLELPTATEEDGGLQKTTEVNRSDEGGCEGDTPAPKPSPLSSSVIPLRSSVSVEVEKKVQDAIEETLPEREGQRHRCVFEFARRLKGILVLADLPAGEFKPVLMKWHTAALPFIETKSFEETWIDFLKSWPKITSPANADFMKEIHVRAVANPLGDYTIPSLRILAAMCRELQAATGQDNPFFLATRTVAGLLGTTPNTAGRWLFLLGQDKILETVVKGGTTENPRKATRFRYLGLPAADVEHVKCGKSANDNRPGNQQK
jgi:hypothetical protein